MRTIEPPIKLSDNAVKRIAHLMSKDQRPKPALRVQVKGGGCAGFQYSFNVDQVAAGDEVIERDGARLVVDAMSLMYLAGSQIDFIEKMIGSQFAIGNPNASSSCSCGASFAI